MTFRLGVTAPELTDACSWYRTMGPLNALAKTHDIEIVRLQKADWVEASAVDAVFMQRPYTADHARAAMIFSKNNVPFWVDWDDLLWDVPKWNPAHPHFASDASQKALTEISLLAHSISVTTEFMAEYIQKKYGRRCYVIPNALADRFALQPPQEGPVTVWWRGGRQHRNDHKFVAEMMIAAAQKSQDIQFCVIGDDPWWTDAPELAGRCKVYADPVDVVFFHDLLRGEGLSILAYGLEDCDFNRAKSACSWLEATMAGSIVVGPDWAEWQRPGIVRYTPGEPGSAGRALLSALAADRTALWTASAAELEARYRLSTVNQARWAIVRSLAAAANKKI